MKITINTVLNFLKLYSFIFTPREQQDYQKQQCSLIRGSCAMFVM